MARYKWLILILALLLILPACAKKEVVPIQEEPVEEVVSPPPLEDIEEPEEEPIEVEEEKPIVLEDIFFDFDKFNIRDEYKGKLASNADVLLAHPEIEFLVEGHCDERGTNEYNLALGEKRAKSVLDYYIAYGVDAKRLSMISYGEERHFDRSNNEEAWAKNRRAHMIIK